MIFLFNNLYLHDAHRNEWGGMSQVKPDEKQRGQDVSLGKGSCSEGRKRRAMGEHRGQQRIREDTVRRARGGGEALRKAEGLAVISLTPACAELQPHRLRSGERLLSVLTFGGGRGQTAGGYGVAGMVREKGHKGTKLINSLKC